MYSTLKETIERIWEHRELLEMPENIKVIEETINLLDGGKIRVAEPDGDGWKVNEWVKKSWWKNYIKGFWRVRNCRMSDAF